MLTLSQKWARFSPYMGAKPKRLFLLLISVFLLQSCYTLLHPPATLPQTVTTVISDPIMTTTLGSSGGYGWDPYWEPALPFTSYHRGYGASYYNPYNYYDYNHPHYAPVYIVGEEASPLPAREYGRDDRQGGSRDRGINIPDGSDAPSNSGESSSGGMSTAAPEISGSNNVDPPIVPPNKSRNRRNTKIKIPSKETTPVIKNDKPKPPPNSKNTDNSKKEPPPKKRLRSRK
ncbi:hypothetical protein HQ531_00460 [bacterium]|nr:hypothetical protein [bacterium]